MEYVQQGIRGPMVSRIAFGNWSAGGDWGSVDREAGIGAACGDGVLRPLHAQGQAGSSSDDRSAPPNRTPSATRRRTTRRVVALRPLT